MRAILIFIFTFFCLSSAAFSADINVNKGGETEQQDGSYYNSRPARGWWFYEYNSPAEKKKEGEDKKPEQAKRRVPSLKDYTMEQLWDMHPDDFQPLLLDFQKKAVMSPTEENVREYYTIQDIARRKALAFTNVAQYVTQKYSDLNLNKDYPTIIPGRSAFIRQQMAEIENTIKEAKDEFALLYFFSPG